MDKKCVNIKYIILRPLLPFESKWWEFLMKDYTYRKDYVNRLRKNFVIDILLNSKPNFFLSLNYYYVKQENNQKRGEKVRDKIIK